MVSAHWQKINFFPALTTVFSGLVTKGRSLALQKGMLKDCPNLANCSCYLGSVGLAASHKCPFTSLVYK